MKKGEIIKFGEYDWRILDVQGGKALLITEYIISMMPYNKISKSITWESCDLRNQLNLWFLHKLGIEQKKITETVIHNPANLWYKTAGGGDTADKLFLLSIDEAERYFGDGKDYQIKNRKKCINGQYTEDIGGEYISNADNFGRAASYNGEKCWWWLRSSGFKDDTAASVEEDGAVCVRGSLVDGGLFHGGVRPAMWIKI